MNSATEAMISVNDTPRPLSPGLRLSGLIGEMGLAEKKGVAVAVNGAVVSRRNWAARELAEAARVLVIQATQGG